MMFSELNLIVWYVLGIFYAKKELNSNKINPINQL
jgi:hypothetical protein